MSNHSHRHSDEEINPIVYSNSTQKSHRTKKVGRGGGFAGGSASLLKKFAQKIGRLSPTNELLDVAEPLLNGISQTSSNNDGRDSQRKSSSSHPRSPNPIGKSRRTRSFAYCLLFCLATGLFILYWVKDSDSVELEKYYDLFQSTTDSACNIPMPNPWDESIQQYLSIPDPLQCKHLQYEMTYIKETTGYLLFNSTAFELSGYSHRELNCQFRCFRFAFLVYLLCQTTYTSVRHDPKQTYVVFRRNEGVDDETLIYDQEWTRFSSKSANYDSAPDRQPGCEFFEVDCSKTFPPVSVYSNVFGYVPINQTLLDRWRYQLNNHHFQRPKPSLSSITKANDSMSQNSPSEWPPNLGHSNKIQQIDQDPEKKEQTKQNIDQQQPQQKPPSVLILILDSVSKSNAVRNLPLLMNVLSNTSDFESVLFNGYSKIGDNSFPNAVAFMAGKKACIQKATDELPCDNSATYFDDWPLIWRDYHEKGGYVTFYAEDYPDFNLFTYLSNGFKRKPTDFYFRPFWLKVWRSFLHRRSTHLCYGNRHKLNVQLEYLGQFLKRYASVPTFAINWETEIGHDWMNQVRVGDKDLANFFTNHAESLQNTIVLVMSDHGHRFDSIRQSVIGRIEERMPMFSISVPKWMRQRFPALVNNLRANANSLTSHFDLYVTLQDILKSGQAWATAAASSTFNSYEQDTKEDNQRSSGKRRKTAVNKLSFNSNNGKISGGTVSEDSVSSSWMTDFSFQPNWSSVSERGQSLLRPLKVNRTCSDVGISEDFCVCQHEKAMDPNLDVVLKAGALVIRHLNDQLKTVSDVCAPLTLKQVRNAQSFLPNQNMVLTSKKSIFMGGSHPTGFIVNYRVAVEAEPSGAVLEGTIRHDIQADRMAVVGDVNRVNKYGRQSHCIKDFVLRKYCFCKQQQ